MLLDAQMPSMDGFTLACKIKEDATLAGPRIMMLSSLDVKSIGPDLAELGLSHYIVKPVTRSNLLKAILRVMGERRQLNPWSAHSRPDRRSLRILVAEDNPINMKVVVLLLERDSVVSARNGAEALDAVTRENFDLILMDVQMPVLNGYDATRAIREREQGTGRHTPIVALTAHAMKGDQELCLQAGMDGYLTKPIKTKELHEMLIRWSEPNMTVPAG